MWPADKRGLYTSWIQTTATFGLFLSLIVILVTRTAVGEDAFAVWGWRIPFLVSVAMLGVSLWIRLQLNESPAFLRMKAEGKASTQPLTDSFARWPNLKLVILALLGLTAGQAVVWYTGQFYALFFLEKVLRVDGPTANILVAVALLIGTPCFILFGWLSDRIGRKPIILVGCLLAALTYFPLFKALTTAANPALAQAVAASPVTVVAPPASCSLQFDPLGKARFTSACDVAKAYLAKAGVSYENSAAAGSAEVRVGGAAIPAPELTGLAAPDAAKARAGFEAALGEKLAAAGYPSKADPAQVNKPLVVGILAVLVLYVTMVYGPIAAMLVEMFPTNIRYTSMSLPYHLGNGWFGGFLPTTAFAIVAATGNIYSGLWYPVIIAAGGAVIGFLFVRETKDVDIHK